MTTVKHGSKMKYRVMESALLDASRTHNHAKHGDVITMLQHKQRVLDMLLDAIPTSRMNFTDTDSEFSKINDEYTEINRLLRISVAYGPANWI